MAVKKAPSQVNHTQITKSYFSDLKNASCLYAKIIRSPVQYGKILSITYEDIPEGCYLFTAEDLEDKNYIETLDVQTEIFASQQINYSGQPLALFVAESESSLNRLSSNIQIKVEEEKLDNHEKKVAYAQRVIRKGKLFASKDKNPDTAFKRAKFDVKGTWTSVLNAPDTSEANGAYCSYEKDVLTISTPTQWPKHLCDNLTRILDIKNDNIIIKKTISSNPYTNTLWLNTNLCAMCALAAVKTGKPVKLVLSREENSSFMVKKSPITLKYRTNVTESGEIKAMQVNIEIDSGYHNPFAAEFLDRLIIASTNIYSVANLLITATAFESHTAPASTNIECIDSQAFFAVENQMQKISRVTGLSPVEIRLLNVNKKISMPFNFEINRLEDTIQAVASKSDLLRKNVSFALENKTPSKTTKGYKANNMNLRGIGMSCVFNASGYFGTKIFACNQKISVTLEKDSSCTIHALPPSSTTWEIWKENVSEILGIEPKNIKLDSNFDAKEESVVPENVYNNISIMTQLLRKCCLDIQAKRFRKPLPISTSKGITAAARKVWNPTKFQGVPFHSTSFGSLSLELEIDPATYRISIKHIYVILNAGKIYLANAAENSIKLAIQHALSEIVEDDIIKCSDISVLFITSDSDSSQLSGIISKLLPAAFASALSQALNFEITSIPVSQKDIFKAMTSASKT